MHFSTAALVAGILATANAFLLPPNIDEIKEEFKDARFRGAPKHFKDLIHSLLEDKTTVVDLQCPGCPFALIRSEVEGPDSIVWQERVENTIHLEFDTHGNGLNLNGNPLYPLERREGAPSLVAHQTKTESGERSEDVELQLVVVARPHPPSKHDHGDTLHLVEVIILGLEREPVKVDSVLVKMIQTPDNNYVIVQTQQIPFKTTPGALTCEVARPWTLCRVRAIITNMVGQIIEASKVKANKVHGWVKDKAPGCGKHRNFAGGPGLHGDFPHGRRPYPPHHVQHHGHHRFHHLGHAIHQTLRFFVVPALLGIIGGLAASAIGMLVGQAIIFIWFKTYRNGQRGPLRIYEREITLIEEKDGLLQNEEILPQYEDIAPEMEATFPRDVEAEAVNSENEKQ